MKNIFIMLFLTCALLLAGCAQKKVVQQELPVQQEILKQPTVAPKEPEQKMPEGRQAEKITDQQLAKIETKEEKSLYTEEKSMFDDIYFDYDKYDVRQDAQSTLQGLSSWVLKNSAVKVLVEGHCDDRGTNEYNLALADRRAKAVRDYLVALGTAPERVEMVSYGEEKPSCKEQTEECWAKNRRAHFVILREAGK